MRKNIKVNAVITKVFGVVDYESENSKWLIQYGNPAYNISVNSGFFFCDCFENSYAEVSGFGDDDSEVRLQKLKLRIQYGGHVLNII